MQAAITEEDSLYLLVSRPFDVRSNKLSLILLTLYDFAVCMFSSFMISFVDDDDMNSCL